jgi:hypothetical protein
MILRKPFFYAFAVTLGLLAATGVLAWTGPAIAPPGSNASAPINTSATSQIKSGAFTATSVGGSTVCVGTNCLNSSGTSIYYTGGNVGIGVASPNYRLEVLNSTIYWPGINIAETSATQRRASLGLGVNAAATSGWIIGQSVGAGTVKDFYVLDVTAGAIRFGIDPAGNIALGGNTTVSGAITSTGITSTGGLTVGNSGGAYTHIVLKDDESPNGVKYIHANSNVIGWLGGSAQWLAYWTNAGDMQNYGGINSVGAVNAPAFYYSSDERLKKNIQAIASSTALQKILALNPVTFNWIPTDRATTTQIGFIAQEVEKVVPELVTTDASTTMKAVDYARVAPLLVGAIQAQQKQIDAQQKQIELLTAKIEALQ